VAPPPPHLSTHSLSLISIQAAYSSLFTQLLSLLSPHSSLPPPIHLKGTRAMSSVFNSTKREYTPHNEYKKVAGRRPPQRRLLQRVWWASFLHGTPCCSWASTSSPKVLRQRAGGDRRRSLAKADGWRLSPSPTTQPATSSLMVRPWTRRPQPLSRRWWGGGARSQARRAWPQPPQCPRPSRWRRLTSGLGRDLWSRPDSPRSGLWFFFESIFHVGPLK
jgi:hypothetical protein